MKHFKKVAFILIGVIVTICLSGFGYVYFKLNKMYVKDEAVKSTEEQGTMVEGITNILLVGTDGEYVEKGNRSDGMMVVTIDSKNKEMEQIKNELLPKRILEDYDMYQGKTDMFYLLFSSIYHSQYKWVIFNFNLLILKVIMLNKKWIKKIKFHL